MAVTLTDRPAIQDADSVYRPGIDDLGDSPLGADNPANPVPDNPADPVHSEDGYRRAVITLLTEIRDLLATPTEGEG